MTGAQMVTMVAAPVVDMVKNVSRISQACILLRARTEVSTSSCPDPRPLPCCLFPDCSSESCAEPEFPPLTHIIHH